jgi:flagellar hook-basal body complex protein FliE
MSGSPIQAIAAIGAVDPALERPAPVAAHAAPATTSFAQLLYDGIDRVNAKANAADAAARSFALDDNIPPHRVLYALEQSSMSLQMMMAVRNRLVEGYQEIMRMQL